MAEDYYYHLAKTQSYYSFISKEIEYGGNKTPDLILVENNKIIFIEEKSFSPNCKTRLMNDTAIKEQINEIVGDLYQLYKFIYLNYPKTSTDLSHFSLDNRFGILSVREDASFDRRILYNGLFERIGELNEVEKAEIIKHIKISNLVEFEDMIFTNTPFSKLIDYYNTGGNEMHFTAQSIYNEKRNNDLLLKFEHDLDDKSTKIIRFLTSYYSI